MAEEIKTIQDIFAQLKKEFPTFSVHYVEGRRDGIRYIMDAGTADYDTAEAMRDRARQLCEELRIQQGGQLI